MIPEVTSLPPLAPSVRAKTLLAKAGVTCALLSLAAGDEISAHDRRDASEQLLVVLDGQATVRTGEVSTILDPEGVLLVAAGSEYSIAASSATGARLLRIDLPPRRTNEPVIHSFDR